VVDDEVVADEVEEEDVVAAVGDSEWVVEVVEAKRQLRSRYPQCIAPCKINLPTPMKV